MFSYWGYLKIIDFSVAVIDRAHDDDMVTAPDKWKLNSGTIHTMAPEVLSQQAYDHRSDYYQVGLLMYHMMTGEHMPIDKWPAHALRSILERDVSEQTLSKHMPHASDEIINLISSLLHVEPSFRLGSWLGIGEILRHPAFRDLNVRELWDHNLPSPFWLGPHKLLINWKQLNKRDMKLKVNEELRVS